MTPDPIPDPKPPNELWVDLPLTADELKDLKLRLTKMAQAQVVNVYKSGLFACRLHHGAPPKAGFIHSL